MSARLRRRCLRSRRTASLLLRYFMKASLNSPTRIRMPMARVRRMLLARSGCSSRIDLRSELIISAISTRDRQVRKARDDHQQVAEAVVAHHLERVAQRVAVLSTVTFRSRRLIVGGDVLRQVVDAYRFAGGADDRSRNVVGAYASPGISISSVFCALRHPREKVGHETRGEADDQRREVDDVDHQQMFVQSLFCSAYLRFLSFDSANLVFIFEKQIIFIVFR